MTPTIGLVANVFNEINALPGWLETHTPFFDDIRVLHAGPQGQHSTDGTLELLEKWGVPVEFCSIDEGFGAVRTRAIRMSPCDYVMILDADERFYPTHRVLKCTGTPTPHSDVDAILREYDHRDGKRPDWSVMSRLGIDLRVDSGMPYDQGTFLRNMLESKDLVGPKDAICTIRRHWHDFSWKRPTQSWVSEPDYQLRIVRNDPSIAFDSSTRMHERLEGKKMIGYSDPDYGPFFDHFHFPFKRMEGDQRAHDVLIYDAIHEGRTPPTEV